VHIRDFIAENNITISVAKLVKSDKEGFSWQVVLAYGNKRFNTSMFMGLAWQEKYSYLNNKWVDANYYDLSRHGQAKKFGEPTSLKLRPKQPSAELVVSGLQSDANSVEQYPTWEDWADCFGYSRDSMKGNAIYKACWEAYVQLKKFFGDKFNVFLACETD
jgi:hypothetical protein